MLSPWFEVIEREQIAVRFTIGPHSLRVRTNDMSVRITVKSVGL